MLLLSCLVVKFLLLHVVAKQAVDDRLLFFMPILSNPASLVHLQVSIT